MGDEPLCYCTRIMADWDDNGVCYIDVVMPLPSCMLEYVMGQWPECFWNRLDSGSLNALLRTNKPLRVLTGGELVKGLTVALKEDSASGKQNARQADMIHDIN